MWVKSLTSWLVWWIMKTGIKRILQKQIVRRGIIIESFYIFVCLFVVITTNPPSFSPSSAKKEVLICIKRKVLFLRSIFCTGCPNHATEQKGIKEWESSFCNAGGGILQATNNSFQCVLFTFCGGWFMMSHATLLHPFYSLSDNDACLPGCPPSFLYC